MPLGHFVLVDQHLSIASVTRPAAKQRRVLFAFLRPREIPVTAQPVRNARVGLLYPAEHFLVQRLLESLMRAHKAFGVLVLGCEVVDNRGALRLPAVTHPCVIVGDLETVDL